MSKERMQRGAHVAGVVLEVPWGHGPPALSPCSGSEVRVLLFNATGDRDTAALLKLLVVRFGGQGWGHCARMPEFPASPGTCFAVGAGSRKVELAVCLSVCLAAHPAIPPQLPPAGVSQSWVQGRDLDHPLPHPL